MKKLTIIVGLLYTLSATAQNMDDVQINATQVAGNIYMLEGSGGNIGLSVGDDGNLMIDSQFGPLSEKIRKAIIEINDAPIKYLVNTHWHGDHVGGNENFANLGSVIIAHENVLERMSTTQLMRAFSREVPPAPEAARPAITFSDDLGIRFNGEHIMVIHVDDAHTDTDAFIYFPETDVLHMGDCYFQGRYPFIDLSSGGSIDGMIAAANTAIFLTGPDTKIIPGHGPLSNKEELIEYRNVMQSIRDKVKAAIKAGKSLDEIKAMKPGKETDEEWGSGFINADTFLDIVYTSLTM